MNDGSAEDFDHALERSFGGLALLRRWKKGLRGGPNGGLRRQPLHLAQHGSQDEAQDKDPDAEPYLGGNIESLH